MKDDRAGQSRRFGHVPILVSMHKAPDDIWTAHETSIISFQRNGKLNDGGCVQPPTASFFPLPSSHNRPVAARSHITPRRNRTSPETLKNSAVAAFTADRVTRKLPKRATRRSFAPRPEPPRHQRKLIGAAAAAPVIELDMMFWTAIPAENCGPACGLGAGSGLRGIPHSQLGKTT